MILHIYSLVGCPYSMKACETLKLYKPKIITVTHDEKEKYKKMNEMSTFPQIFLVIDDKHRIKIGGYNETINLLTKIFNKDPIPYNKADSEKLIKFFTNKK